MSFYAARRRRNAVAMGLSVAAAVFGLAWLALILGALLWQGLSGLSPRVFTEATPPPGGSGGLLNAIAGSLIMTALAVAIGTPLGVLAGTYISPLTKCLFSRSDGRNAYSRRSELGWRCGRREP